jgi:hypothetical protein
VEETLIEMYLAGVSVRRAAMLYSAPFQASSAQRGAVHATAWFPADPSSSMSCT